MSDRGESQMDAKGGYDTADAAGYRPDVTTTPVPKQPSPYSKGYEVIQDTSEIKSDLFNSSVYEKCSKIGKAVIVSNFMEGYQPRSNKIPKDPEVRSYASKECDHLKEALENLGFESLDGDMVHKNLTKRQFIELYDKVAKTVNYRPKDQTGYTCVLFVVISYGKTGLIKCHAESDRGDHEYVEQKQLQEAFQPQNNHSLALKPKIFFIQTIPEAVTDADDHGGQEIRTTKRIPREADFLTYSCDSYCIDRRVKDKVPEGPINCFIGAVVDTLKELHEDQKNNKQALEIQKMLIRINKKYKDKRGKNTDWKIPCTTSSLTKQLYLF